MKSDPTGFSILVKKKQLAAGLVNPDPPISAAGGYVGWARGSFGYLVALLTNPLRTNFWSVARPPSILPHWCTLSKQTSSGGVQFSQLNWIVENI
jgi:hypothetical protein